MKKIVLIFSFTLLFFSSLYADMKQNQMIFGYYLPSLCDTDPKDIKISLDFWAKEIGGKNDFVVKSKFYKNLNKMKRDFREKKIDVLTASGLILATKFNSNEFYEGFQAMTNDFENKNRLLLLVHRDKHYQKIADLRNKTIARLRNEDVENLYFNLHLQKQFHRDSNTFFKKTVFTKSYSKAILKLFFKKVDAALVKQEAYDLALELNPQIGTKLKALVSIEPSEKSTKTS